jgi:hypothetical protein
VIIGTTVEIVGTGVLFRKISSKEELLSSGGLMKKIGMTTREKDLKG